METKKQPKPYPVQKEKLISMSKEAKQEQQDNIKNYRKKYHYCEYTTTTQNWGDAIKHCYEDQDGCFWAGHNEYESQVNYCPYCGAKAPVQAIGLTEMKDAETKRLANIEHALKVTQGYYETAKWNAKERYQKDIDHINSLLKDDQQK